MSFPDGTHPTTFETLQFNTSYIERKSFYPLTRSGFPQSLPFARIAFESLGFSTTHWLKVSLSDLQYIFVKNVFTSTYHILCTLVLCCFLFNNMNLSMNFHLKNYYEFPYSLMNANDIVRKLEILFRNALFSQIIQPLK